MHPRQDFKGIASVDFDEKSWSDYKSAVFKNVLVAETADGERCSFLSDYDF